MTTIPTDDRGPQQGLARRSDGLEPAGVVARVDELLEVAAEEENRGEGTWTFVYEHDAVRYTVTIGTMEGLADFARVRREQI